ncbi:MAG: M23 family metallopeptidase [Acidobacteria bacterium]|nr:M23 family metallopeptidase [Acidobacteriota bacterium]
MISFPPKSKALAMIQAIALALIAWPYRGLSAGSTSAPPNTLAVTSSPEVIVNGSPCLFRVTSQRPLRSLRGRWQGRRVFFDFDANDGSWYGFAGVGLDAAAGRRRLTLEATTAKGARFSLTHPVRIERADYRSVTLSVPDRFTAPDAETLARVKEERALKNEVFARVTPSRLWSGNFEAPIDSVITSEFGVRRMFNRRVRSFHQGLDLRADTGVPVEAMNNGVVIVARDMFFEGGFVVVDHGQGLLSLYMHLSEIRVNEGDSVATRQIIALSGGTGRVTAPHLHVGVRWQGIYIDPAVLLTLPLP